MRARFEELAWRETTMGEISLRRRFDPVAKVDVYEVRLDDDFLMSSLFTVAEVELARLGLAELSGGGIDVVVGGLGLGYTARAVLDDRRVRSCHSITSPSASTTAIERSPSGGARPCFLRAAMPAMVHCVITFANHHGSPTCRDHVAVPCIVGRSGIRSSPLLMSVTEE